MAEILSALQTVCGTVWNTLMSNRLLPSVGFEVKTVFLFTWLACILVEFARVWIFADIEEHLDDD